MVCIIIPILRVRCHENHTAKVVVILEIDHISEANELAKEFLGLRRRSLLDGSVDIVGRAQVRLEECRHGGDIVIVLTVKEFRACNKED